MPQMMTSVAFNSRNASTSRRVRFIENDDERTPLRLAQNKKSTASTYRNSVSSQKNNVNNKKQKDIYVGANNATSVIDFSSLLGNPVFYIVLLAVICVMFFIISGFTNTSIIETEDAYMTEVSSENYSYEETNQDVFEENVYYTGEPTYISFDGLVYLSDEMKYFCKYESSQNYNQGLTAGDNFHALGYYQIDNRYELEDFLAYCYNYDSDLFYMFAPYMRGNDEGYSIRDDITWNWAAEEVEAAWHEAYESDPELFSTLQDTFIYNVSYVSAERDIYETLGIDISNRADCVKGLCWGMVNLFGITGWHKFIGGNGYEGCGLYNEMSDYEFVTTLCDYVSNNVADFYSAQPQYHEGWSNRYQKEKNDCYYFLNA